MRKMKESGIEWIGEIPEDWKILRVKDGFTVKKAKAYQKEPIVLTLARSGVKVRDMTNADGQFAVSYFEYNPVSVNDMLINPMDLISGDNCSLSKVEGVISPAYVNLRYKNDYNPSFYNYYFKYQYWSKAFFVHGKGVSYENRWTLNTETLLKFPLIVPPSATQQRIADFLDAKCANIDSLKSDIQKQIETLEQYKKSVITETVTKGLNPNTKMKNNGSKWLPSFPAHWEMKKLKYNLSVHEVKGYAEKEVLSLYRELGIVPKNSRDDNHNVTSEDTSKYKYVRVGDFVINKMKAWQGSVAVSDCEGIVSPAYYIYEFTNDSYDKKYFHHLMRNKILADEFRRISGGIREGQWDLDREQFENMYLPVPPKAEQIEIVKYIESKYGNIEKSIDLKKKQLEKLEEYKKSLIFEYVTGKREV